MADRCRGCSPRGAHALPTPPRRASALQKKASACPTHSPAPFASLSPSPRAAPSHSRPPLLRLRLACSPSQKRVAQLISSFAVIPSTTSTVQSSHSSQGKGVFAILPTAAMAGARRSWCSTRPAVLAPSHPVLCLALGHRNTTEARRVTVRGCVAVSSPEPAMPWLCAAVSVADPSSHYPSTD